ncbi:hypothetical protein MKW92_037628 [Papaver armeniacum]|nr:hypothetical protein MKW92_037628 [Papaver armeniacum]
MIICISISIERGSAWWPNICSPGETYTMRNYINTAEVCESNFCNDWCNNICSSIGTSAAKNNCQKPSPDKLNVQCCCKVPTPAPGSPPSPSLPPAPPSPPPSPGPWPDVPYKNICASGQEYAEAEHANITDCAFKPQCENKCKEKGLSGAGSQCIGGAVNSTIENRWYYVLEQCCCGNLPPPPPPPSPSPPPPCPSPPLPPPSPSPPCPSCPPPENTCDVKDTYCCCTNNTPILSSPSAAGRLLSFITG